MAAALYSGIPFSPQAALTNNIGAADSIIAVSDVSAFPPAPNLATIGTDEEGETILYTAKTDTALSGCQRGVEGTARAWTAGELIGRNFTAKDHNDLIAAVSEVRTGVETAQGTADAALDAAAAANKEANSADQALLIHENSPAAHGELFLSVHRAIEQTALAVLEVKETADAAVTTEQLNETIQVVSNATGEALNAKQDKLTGEPGQVVGFASDGTPEAQEAVTMAEVNAAISEAISGIGGGVPSGCILIWSGSADNIPEGWALCDGANGTPDLRDKFVLGAGGNRSVGAIGGTETVTLTTVQIPAHKHNVIANGNVYTYEGSGEMYGVNTNKKTVNTTSSAKKLYDVTDTMYTGGGTAHNNMPPYYALCYIMKL